MRASCVRLRPSASRPARARRKRKKRGVANTKREHACRTQSRSGPFITIFATFEFYRYNSSSKVGGLLSTPAPKFCILATVDPWLSRNSTCCWHPGYADRRSALIGRFAPSVDYGSLENPHCALGIASTLVLKAATSHVAAP